MWILYAAFIAFPIGFLTLCLGLSLHLIVPCRRFAARLCVFGAYCNIIGLSLCVALTMTYEPLRLLSVPLAIQVLVELTAFSLAVFAVFRHVRYTKTPLSTRPED